MPNRITDFEDGVTYATAAVLNGEWDNIYTGTIDRTGGRWGSYADVPITLGNTQESQISFSGANGCMTIGVDAATRRLLICDKGDVSTAFGFAAGTNPSVTIHSASTTANENLTLSHDGTSGIIYTGTGPVQFLPAGVLALSVHSNGMVIESGNRIELSNSAVNHGMTTILATSSYGYMNILDPSDGGLQLIGASDAASGLFMSGLVNTVNTVKTTAAGGAVHILGGLRSGTSRGDLSANANIVVISNNASAKFIFDVEGEAHADVSWTTFDAFDDVALINDLERGITQGFGEMLTYNRDVVERAGIAHFDEKPGHAMINMTRLSMLLCGALKQTNDRISRLEQRLLEA